MLVQSLRAATECEVDLVRKRPGHAAGLRPWIPKQLPEIYSCAIEHRPLTQISPCEEVHRGAGFVYGLIEIFPGASDLHVGLIQPPAGADRPLAGTELTVQLGRVFDDPAIERRMVNLGLCRKLLPRVGLGYADRQGERNSTMIEFKGSHFESDLILWGVRWYVAYPIIYRQLEEMMEGRGVEVDHSTLNRWVVKYAPELDRQFRSRKRPVGSSWRLDETYVKIRGSWKYLYRA